MIRNGVERNRGFVLIVALGVLGVLGLLAATFATLSKVEKQVSSSYVDKVRAKLLAQSGVERAIAAIRGRALKQAWDDERNDWYYRELLNEETATLKYPDGVNVFDSWIPTRKYGMQPRSLEAAMNDGFLTGNRPGLSFSDKTNKNISGSFAGTYQPDGDIYGLKVIDCSSQIYVNDAQKNITFLLNNLGSILKTVDGVVVNLSVGGSFKLGDQIKLKAASRGTPFNNKNEVRDEVFINNPVFTDKVLAAKCYDAVKDFISCHEWVDGMTTRFDTTWGSGGRFAGGSYASTQGGSGGTVGGSTTGGTSSGTIPGGVGGTIPGGIGGTKPGGIGGTLPIDVIDVKDDGSTDGTKVDGSADGSTMLSAPMPEYATTPLYTIRAEIPGAYISLPATNFYAAAFPSVSTNKQKGGGFDQQINASGAETVAGQCGLGAHYFKEPRAPININTCSREVLVATLMNLHATFWDYDTVSEGGFFPTEPKREYTGGMVQRNVTLSQAQAEVAADFIISGRFTFGSNPPNYPPGSYTFNDWMHFEEDCVDKMPLDRFQRALICANGNPNSMIRKLNPDIILVKSSPYVEPTNYVHLDKSDIDQPTTDYTFSSNGYFEIECVGRVYEKDKVVAEEKIETVVKVFDMIKFTTQEQFEQDRVFVNDDPKQGDLASGGYPPVITMPEYAYNNTGTHYKAQQAGAAATNWCADYDGYLILNGPVKVNIGIAPGPAGSTSCCTDPSLVTTPDANFMSGAVNRTCRTDFFQGFNMATLAANQAHHQAAHIAAGSRHPEYAYTMPTCWGISFNFKPIYSCSNPLEDSQYKSDNGLQPRKAYQIEPTGAGANFWDEGCDMQNFGVYMNSIRRGRFLTYFADEVPGPDCTIEMTVKPEVDTWYWSPKSSLKSAGSYFYGPCSRLMIFEWGVPASGQGMNYEVRCYVQLSRVFLDFYYQPAVTAEVVPAGAANKFFIMYADHQWKPHTWHHVEASWARKTQVTPAGAAAPCYIPANAMLFVDGKSATSILSSTFVPPDVNGYGVTPNAAVDSTPRLPYVAYPGTTAMVLPSNVIPPNYNQNMSTGPRFVVGGKLQSQGSFKMAQPSFIGTIDNIVMHHWRSHIVSFTPRNRYHSVSYYDAAFPSGQGFAGEKAGVYKKSLVFLNNLVNSKNVTIGTLACTHYHPYHEHMTGHDAAAGPITPFGHVSPELRYKNGGGGGTDRYAYDGCAGYSIGYQASAGDLFWYLGWFEVAAAVPVTQSPIVEDFSVTYMTEPVTYYRLSSSEAKK